MPNIDSLPVASYQPLNPYHHYFDNLPIESLLDQIQHINYQTDINDVNITDAIGTTGSLANRLNKSLDPDGGLKTTAVDDAGHSIEEHTDSDTYVRMLVTERDKLSLIESEATDTSIQVNTISTTITWPNASNIFKLIDSDTVAWSVVSNEVSANLTFSETLIVNHYYDVSPVTDDNQNFQTSSMGTEYKTGTLRIYINGLRITTSPKKIGGFYYGELDPASGTFNLNKTISGSDIIRIDFDQPIN